MATVRIPLTQGKFAVIDEADEPIVAPYKWVLYRGSKSNGEKMYAVTWLRLEDGRYKPLLMHLLLCPGHDEIDHWDGDGLNNTRSNMRPCTHSQNMKNRKRGRDNTSGFKGVYWSKYHGHWRATIRCDGKRYTYSGFTTAVDAAVAYDEAARRLHGKFASLNFPEDGERWAG